MCYRKMGSYEFQTTNAAYFYVWMGSGAPTTKRTTQSIITVDLNSLAVTKKDLNLTQISLTTDDDEDENTVVLKTTYGSGDPIDTPSVKANPTLKGTEDNLTGVQVGVTRYKIPQGDITAAGDNTFTGNNKFDKSITLHNEGNLYITPNQYDYDASSTVPSAVYSYDGITAKDANVNATYKLKFPMKAGTFALTSDIPDDLTYIDKTDVSMPAAGSSVTLSLTTAEYNALFNTPEKCIVRIKAANTSISMPTYIYYFFPAYNLVTGGHFRTVDPNG